MFEVLTAMWLKVKSSGAGGPVTGQVVFDFSHGRCTAFFFRTSLLHGAESFLRS
jgi:hypothetical protein